MDPLHLHCIITLPPLILSSLCVYLTYMLQQRPLRPPAEPPRRSLRNLGKDAPDYRETADFLLKVSKYLRIDGEVVGAFMTADKREMTLLMVQEGGGGGGLQHRIPIGFDNKGAGDGPGESWDDFSSSNSKRPRPASSMAVGSEPSPGSSRTLNANVDGMLSQYLGKKVPGTGKQLVMDLLTMPGAGHAKFSK